MGKKRILVIDDDELTLEFMRNTLETEGFEVITALNALDACHHLSGSMKLDLLIVDVNLNIGSGDQIVVTMKRNETTKSIPIVYLSCTHEHELKELARQTGADGYITKPAFPTEVICEVNRVLGLQVYTI